MKNKTKSKKSGSSKYIIIGIILIAVILAIVFLSKGGEKYPREAIDNLAK